MVCGLSHIHFMHSDVYGAITLGLHSTDTY